MKTLRVGQTIAVRYKDQDFELIISRLRQEALSSHATLLAFTGMPKLQMDMAARELAVLLGRPLYRVDMNAVASKYIGETEKNLRGALASASAAGSVLLFDEADALFRTRTGVNDAHDRYGNLERNFLMEIISRPRGLAIGLCNSVRESDLSKDRLRQMIVRQMIVKFPSN